MIYRAYTLQNFQTIPQICKLSKELQHDIKVVGRVLPFKVNNYVVKELIDWDNLEEDPIFRLTFPQKEMLIKQHYEMIDAALKQQDATLLKKAAYDVRMQLNPQPDGQLTYNRPDFNGKKLTGVQHKYQETVLFFPSAGQTCHSFCTFCFRWSQFVSLNELKFAMKEIELVIRYLQEHKEVTDIIYTGGDPMAMNFTTFHKYIEPFLGKHQTNIQTIRIGTKVLSFWPDKFLTDRDADDFIRLFEAIVKKGFNLSIMAHFTHPRELETQAVQRAISRLRSTGAQIRSQAPLIKHINDSPATWATMWRKQVNLNCIPYYMFVARDTGAQNYFAVPLFKAWQIFREAYNKVSGICRTVRGPSMSATPGKIQILGVKKIGDEKVFVLRFLQGRNSDWVGRPFFAKFDEAAIWLDDLEPIADDKFFFE